jgi:predicted phosphate transport protein (TIGR00153 family)
MSRRLFGWFAPKRGEKVLEMVEKHLDLTQSAAINLHRMIEVTVDSNQGDKNAVFTELSRFEREADELRRNMVKELTVREMYPEERDDLMELVRAVDQIADWSKEAGRILRIVSFERAPESIQNATLNMTKANIDCVEVLSLSIRALYKSPSKALGFADEVEMLEETIDDLYGELRYQLAIEEFPGFRIGALVMMNKFFDAIETVADWCENTADIVRAIAVRRS